MVGAQMRQGKRKKKVDIDPPMLEFPVITGFGFKCPSNKSQKIIYSVSKYPILSQFLTPRN